jgi:rhodanese-related sulfurtransferase
MNSPVPTLGVQEVFELIQSGAQLIDVREPHEFDEVRAVGAQLVPLNTVPEHLGSFASHRFESETEPGSSGPNPLFVICRSGARSHAACEWLISQGVNAINIAGGTLAWVAAELPTESSENE